MTDQLFCPFCEQPLRSDVPMKGQTVTCPGCSANVQMPQHDPEAIAAAQQAASSQSLLGCIGTLLGLLLLGMGLMRLAIAWEWF